MKNIRILIVLGILFFGGIQNGMSQAQSVPIIVNGNGETPVHFNSCEELSTLSFLSNYSGAYTGNYRYTWKLLRDGIEIDQFIQSETITCDPTQMPCQSPAVFFTTSPVSGNYSIRFIARKYTNVFGILIAGPTRDNIVSNTVSVTRFDDGLSCNCEMSEYINISPSDMLFLNTLTNVTPFTVRARKDIVAQGVQIGVNKLTLKAGERVILKNAFRSVGSFHALIESCDGMRPEALLGGGDYENEFIEFSKEETYTENYNGLEMEEVVFKIYPNPNNGQFNVELNGYSGAINLVVYDMMGKQVIVENGINNHISINITDQPKGIYFVKVKIGEKEFNEKIVYQ